MSNWITQMFRDWGIKLTDNPTCKKCGKGFKEHSDDDLLNCVEIQ
ncbi:hypothetical protein LCGC14_1889490 [marine sediment metagenome]|uniref:Uncharacterized protein n=1 Tax=marine sediment metagenome TaxID=412755 RepID=A0A0F9IDT1_9ZZZZ